VVPDADLVEDAIERAVRNARRVERRGEARVLRAVGTNGLADDERRVEHAVEVQAPGRAVVAGGGVVPGPALDHRLASDRVVQPGRGARCAFLEVGHELTARRVDPEVEVHVDVRAVLLIAALGHQWDRGHAAGPCAVRDAGAVAVEPGLDRELGQVKCRRVAECHPVVDPVEVEGEVRRGTRVDHGDRQLRGHRGDAVESCESEDVVARTTAGERDAGGHC
jgi:hypothetical protein